MLLFKFTEMILNEDSSDIEVGNSPKAKAKEDSKTKKVYGAKQSGIQKNADKEEE